eukprot:TRINITY_DN5822_c0_g1_i1.p1 TRINITY_DN5822_c0_g1~~TRINITY_DN5822_c0_g1_i1.p1  ORF type:complete len:958 (-),score=309.01 TRINITY_DN5822_c0_g1_i1:36-2831(-)
MSRRGKGAKGAKGKRGNRNQASTSGNDASRTSTAPPAAAKVVAMVGPVVLAAKEAVLYKTLAALFEQKKYKKALKNADQILKKYPTHGETLAMKGLVFNNLDKKEEAYDLVRRGLRHGLTSHVCWHVYGLLYRSDLNYDQACKCYLNALKHDPANTNILRDLSHLQVQLREYEGFVESRRKLLQLKPTPRIMWIGLVLAYHLNSNYTSALHIMGTYQKSVDFAKEGERNPVDVSEMLMYHNRLLEEKGDLRGALAHLTEHDQYIKDRPQLREKRASLLSQLGHKAEARQQYEDLLRINPENRGHLLGWEGSVGFEGAKDLPEDKVTELLALYATLPQLARSTVAATRALEFIPGSNPLFREKLGAFLIPQFRKTVPSLFVTIKALLVDQTKCDVVEELVKSYTDALESESGVLPGETEKKKEAPSTLLAALFFQAQFYDHLGRFDDAFAHIDKVIAHTPTFIDVYVFKGRLHKHVGDPAAAAAAVNEARELDLADRFLNTKSTKYFLRADDVDTADNTIKLFTKDGDVSSQQNLFDMQCMWYESECARSWEAQNDLGRALKKYIAITSHFHDISEDQFDFHGYCMRKLTLRAYVDLLRLEDRLHAHPDYYTAASGAVRCYLRIHRERVEAEAKKKEEDNESNLSEVERKKAASKLRRQQARAKADEAKAGAVALSAKATEEKKKTSAQMLRSKETLEDPNGEALFAKADPLAEAAPFLKKLLLASPRHVAVLTLACEYYAGKGRHLLVLQSLKRALAVEPENAELHVHHIRFLRACGEEEGVVKSVIEAELAETPSLRGDRSAEQVSDAFFAKAKQTSLQHVVCAVQAKELLLPSPSPSSSFFKESAAAITAALELPTSRRGSSVKDIAACVLASDVLKRIAKTHGGAEGDAAVATFVEAIKKRHPRAVAIHGKPAVVEKEKETEEAEETA